MRKRTTEISGVIAARQVQNVRRRHAFPEKCLCTHGGTSGFLLQNDPISNSRANHFAVQPTPLICGR
jgi:hypothetical protein